MKNVVYQSMKKEIKNQKIQNIIAEIKEEYLTEDRYNRPWIIGFSGGKDSTVLLTLVWMALQDIRSENPGYLFKRSVHVVCNNTLVENPIIEEYVNDALKAIEKAAKDQKLPISVEVTQPDMEDRFWYCTIGKGYPVPNSAFRYCTEKMKIRPTSTFLLDKVAHNGEAVILIGTRISESARRAYNIQKHEIKGKIYSKHPITPNAYNYAPIKELMLEEVWYIINAFPSPWGFDNSILFNIYMDASSDDYECPTIVTDESHRSCGQSRFGCWVCTLAKEDRSMSSLIKNGAAWMKPLLEYHDWLIENRNLSENREPYRRDGSRAVDDSGHNQGVCTMEYRVKMLTRLLQIQKDIQRIKPHIQLIQSQELTAIDVLWNREGNAIKSVKDIYKDVYGYDFIVEDGGYTERKMLQEACGGYPEDYSLVQKLLAVQRSKGILMKNYGLQTDFEKQFDEFINSKNVN